MTKGNIVQFYSFISEIILIAVLVKIMLSLNNAHSSAITNKQYSIRLINGSLAFIAFTASIGAIKYLGIDNINLSYLHDLFSLLSKQLAMPIAIVFIVKNKIESSSNQLSNILPQILCTLLVLCLTSFILVNLLSLPSILYKVVDITLVTSSVFLMIHAIKQTRGVLHSSVAFTCLIAMALLPNFFSSDSQIYIASLHIFLASYLYLLSKTI